MQCDTAGQECFRMITSLYYRGAHGVCVVRDVTDMNSFNNVKPSEQEHNRSNVNSVDEPLVGNKTDITDKRIMGQIAAIFSLGN